MFEAMDAHELQDLNELSKSWVKYLEKFLTQIVNTKSMVFCIKPKDEIKSGNAGLVRSEEFPEDKLLLKEDVC